MVTFPNERGVQMALPEADYSGFPEFFEIAQFLCSQKLHYPRGDNPTPNFISLNSNRKAHEVVECIPAL